MHILEPSLLGIVLLCGAKHSGPQETLPVVKTAARYAEVDESLITAGFMGNSGHGSFKKKFSYLKSIAGQPIQSPCVQELSAVEAPICAGSGAKPGFTGWRRALAIRRGSAPCAGGCGW